jgi:hypothetical protein
MKLEYLEMIYAPQNCMHGENKIKFRASMLQFGPTSFFSPHFLSENIKPKIYRTTTLPVFGLV